MFGGESFGWMALKVARGLFAYVTKIIYELIAWVYELLFTVSKIRLLNRSFCLSSDGVNYIKEVGGTSLSSVSDDRARLLCEGVSGVWTKSPITAIYQRVTLLLAIIMVFYVTFQFIKYLITPVEISDKEKGVEKLGFKLITVVALLAVVPTLFDKAYELQDRALNTHFLAKLVLGVTPSEEPDENGVVVPYDRRFGRSFAADILEGFYYFDPIYSGKYAGLDPSSYESKDELCENMPCNLLVYLTTKRLRTVGSLDYINYGLDDYGTVADGVNVFYIHYDWILGNVIGAIVLWMLISYAIDVGIRVIQLTFLQIIAPIPIISFLSPNKDGSFQRWVKQSLLTYLDLFIRLAVIYFTMLVIDIITKYGLSKNKNKIITIKKIIKINGTCLISSFL